MRHYEIVFLVHPDQSEQVPAMITRYKTIIENNKIIAQKSEILRDINCLGRWRPLYSTGIWAGKSAGPNFVGA